MSAISIRSRFSAIAGLVKTPLFVQFVLGMLGGIGADPGESQPHEAHGRPAASARTTDFPVLAAGRAQMPLITMAATIGGNVRVGLEDSLYDGAGARGEQRRAGGRIRRILEELSLEIATPDEARAIAGAEGRRPGDFLNAARQARNRRARIRPAVPALRGRHPGMRIAGELAIMSASPQVHQQRRRPHAPRFWRPRRDFEPMLAEDRRRVRRPVPVFPYLFELDRHAGRLRAGPLCRPIPRIADRRGPGGHARGCPQPRGGGICGCPSMPPIPRRTASTIGSASAPNTGSDTHLSATVSMPSDGTAQDGPTGRTMKPSPPPIRCGTPEIFLRAVCRSPIPSSRSASSGCWRAPRNAGCTHEQPTDYGLGPIAAIHYARYLDFLENIFMRWQRIEGASEEVFPNIHPPRAGLLSGLGRRPGRLSRGRYRPARSRPIPSTAPAGARGRRSWRRRSA